MRVIAILALGLSLGGCITDDLIAQRNARDDQKCQSYGARPGTDAYVTCRAQLDSARATARAIDGAAPGPAPVQVYGPDLSRQPMPSSQPIPGMRYR
jgi:hypothetical protein